MTITIRPVLVLMFLAAGFGCCAKDSNSLRDESGLPVSFTVVWESRQSGLSEPTERVITNQENWKIFTEKLLAPYSTPPKLDSVDFSHEMVVAVGLGMRRTDGYSLEIQNIERREGSLEIFYLETEPGSNCLLSQVITYPCVVVRLPSFTGAVRFHRRVKQEDCQE